MALNTLGLPNPQSISQIVYFANGMTSRTTGLDLTASYSRAIGEGSLQLASSINYNQTLILSRETRSTSTGRVIQLVGDARVGDLEHSIPRWRGNLSARWADHSFSFLGRVNYYGKASDYDSSGSLVVGDEIVVDVEIGLRVGSQVQLTIGAQNLFDNYPDRDLRAIYPLTGGTTRGAIFWSDSPSGINGGFWYLKIGKRF